MYLRRSLHWLFATLCMGIVSLATIAPANAQAPDAPPENLTLEAVADSYISNTIPEANFGAEDILTVAYDFTTETDSIIRFDFSELPADAVVTHAELLLYQHDAAGEIFEMDIARVLEDWSETEVTWITRPDSQTQYSLVRTSAASDEEIALDITAMAQQWVHTPGSAPNYGLAILPYTTSSGHRTYSAREGEIPPRLYIEYELPPDVYTAANDAAEVEIDGICDTEGEYAGVAPRYYIDTEGIASAIFIKHTSRDLFVCIQGDAGQFSDRFFAVNIDTDLTNNDGGNTVPDGDDYSLRVEMGDGVSSEFQGTGDDGAPFQEFPPQELVDWSAAAAINGNSESAEFRINLQSLADYSPHCGAPIGLGLFHQDVDARDDHYGWPSAESPVQPNTWLQFRLQNPQCPIRVCVQDGTGSCTPSSSATVYRVADGAAFSVDSAGYIGNRDQIAAGEQLWAGHLLSETARYEVYATNGEPQTVNYSAFNEDGSGVMTLTARPQTPLLVHDLAVSTQWPLTPAQKEDIANKLRRAAEYLYDFTQGQMILGDITVYQYYENWDSADLWIYGNNNLRPKATAGGVVDAPLADPGGAALRYYPGQIHMGSYWNRYHLPPGQPIIVDGAIIDPATLQDDWSIVLTHELGHYLLFLFDTYFSVGPRNTIADVYSCVGSAMGWVYEEENWGFIHDEAAWQKNCATTHANQLLGREEWTTIKEHYPALQRPTTDPAPGLDTPPVGLTNVSFIDPANAPSLLNNQVFDLLYQNNATASRKAQAYLIRGDRILAQGNPPKGSTQVELTGAAAGDRFCVYDIDDAPPTTDTPRHQYGCEILEPLDYALLMERDTSWAPVVLVDPVGPRSLAVSVTQSLGGASIRTRLFPEHGDTSYTHTLSTEGDMHTTRIDLPSVTPSAFLQVFVDEAASETNPRREAMATFGTGGGTVPGPSSWNAKAPVYSGDDEAVAWPPQNVQLGPDEWVSMQYMVETFPTPTNATRLSDAYRVISWPPELAQEIIVNIRAPALGSAAQAAETDQASVAGASAQTLTQPLSQPLAVRYWDGDKWIAVGTNVSRGPDGRYQASATVPKGTVFALFQGPVNHYLPAVRR